MILFLNRISVSCGHLPSCSISQLQLQQTLCMPCRKLISTFLRCKKSSNSH